MADHYDLSTQQVALWPFRAAVGVVQAVVARPPGTTAETVTAAWLRLAARYEVLRTTYEQPAGLLTGVQAVHDTAPPPPIVFDDDATDEHLIGAGAARSRDPLGDPVFNIAANAAQLVVTANALALDGDGVADLATALLAELAGTTGGIDDPLQYADYAAWQRETAEDGAAAANGGDVLGGTAAGTTSLPFSVGSASGAEIRIPVPVGAVAPIVAAAERYGRRLVELVGACWLAFAHRATDDAVVGVDVWHSNRGHADLEGALGRFGRFAPLTIDLESDPTIIEVLDAVGRANDALTPDLDRDLSTTGAATTGVQAVPPGVRVGRAGHALLVWTDGHAVGIVADPTAFADGAPERIAAQLGTLIADAVARPDARVSTLSVLDAESRELVFGAWNDTAVEWPVALDVVAAFEGQVQRVPDRDAVTSGSQRLSYRALDERANAIAHALHTRGVVAGGVVGMCLDRSVDTIAAALGIMKAGAAYLPLNIEHPPARIAHQLAETGASIVVTVSALRDLLPPSITTLDLDEHGAGVTQTMAPARSFDSNARAYVMYTSGSTGLPKGVEVTHANLANYSFALAQRLGLDQARDALRCGSVTAISTDLGNTAIFPALVSGHTVDLVPVAVVMDPNLYAAYVETSPIDILKVTPSHLRALLSAGAARVLPRHTLILGGETSSWDLVDTVRAASASLRVLNHYGPTETTIGSCTYDVPATPPAWAARGIPLGRPIANSTCTIVDPVGHAVGIGIPGELWIGGAGVARGYVAQPDQTAERFGADPFRATQRVYRTGDKARFWPDGVIEFLGRVDDQVKIRGHRIEPREIAEVLVRHAQVSQAAVVARDDTPGDLRLVAYVVTTGNPDVADLRATVRAVLPEVMVPSAFVAIAALPLTPSGKLDRRALPAPGEASQQLTRPRVAPSTPAEEQLVAVWSEVLQRDDIGVDDDFFELGGHSLLAAQVVARVRYGFGVEVPLHVLFTAPTVAQLAAEIDALRGSGAPADDAELDALLAELSDDEIARLLAEE